MPKAPWEDESIIFGDEKDNATPYKREKAPWEFGSLTSSELNGIAQEKEKAANYKMKNPWDIQYEDIANDFENQLKTIDYRYREPWNETSTELAARTVKESKKTEGYKYTSLWEPPKMSQERLNQIKNYSAGENCPFLREDNYKKPDDRPTRRPLAKQTKTIPPWAQGTLPGAPIMKNTFQRPQTSLWDVPKTTTSNINNPLGTSDDPVLNSLKNQLFAHGSAGIFGLSRKFRIMDDDGSGTLSWEEFKKGMKECELVDLSDPALHHLFRYFGK